MLEIVLVILLFVIIDLIIGILFYFFIGLGINSIVINNVIFVKK